MGNVWGRVSGEGGCHWLKAHEVMLTEVTYGATLSSPTEVCSISGHSEYESIFISYGRDFIRYTW